MSFTEAGMYVVQEYDPQMNPTQHHINIHVVRSRKGKFHLVIDKGEDSRLNKTYKYRFDKKLLGNGTKEEKLGAELTESYRCGKEAQCHGRCYLYRKGKSILGYQFVSVHDKCTSTDLPGPGPGPVIVESDYSDSDIEYENNNHLCINNQPSTSINTQTSTNNQVSSSNSAPDLTSYKCDSLDNIDENDLVRPMIDINLTDMIKDLQSSNN